ncbi:DeoR/GlpR family DNA-binding transcription regulator [Gilliamella sp. wkB112]|uniref:DeoR/GlpR family DNA-binding transcription regulator n=1 Tax=Gilliamella sp. wkB112 TaxID=3120257 RepID=UPI00080DD3B0|nr:DeoR/GlpR family DNA-binding transcription regulator [Gilliamella apicola]OCG03981.1 DeoR family transcriptional regulator [Gilliamella apicola]
MIPSERQQRIIDLVAKKGVISINFLVETLNVSHMTIRRDIQKLEEKGIIMPVSGGIQSLEKLPFEPSHIKKSQMFEEQKDKISQCAVQYIPLNASIYLDAGTTTLAIAKQITHRADLIVFTNDFVIANYLIEYGCCKIIHTGGTICRENYSSVGEFAARMLSEIYVDIAFISTSSWSLQGLSTPDENKIAVKKVIANSSGTRILVTDSSKYGKVATFSVLPLKIFDVIITDSNLSENTIKAMKEQNLVIKLV